MTYKIIDSHCHIHDEKFLPDLSQVLERANNININYLITIGCDIKTTKKALELAEKVDNIYFSSGFHPHEAKFLTPENLLLLKNLSQHKKCLSIGETGLDYYYEHSSKPEQKKAFIEQIKLSKELNLPLVIHLRDAFSDCLEIFDKYLDKQQKLVIHCFTGKIEEAKEFISRGFYISISGVISFKNPGDLLEVVRMAPIDKLLIETDSPYLAPVPYRGQRNEPSYIIKTLETIAKARQEDLEKIANNIYQNSLDFFNLPKIS